MCISSFLRGFVFWTNFNVFSLCYLLQIGWIDDARIKRCWFSRDIFVYLWFMSPHHLYIYIWLFYTILFIGLAKFCSTSLSTSFVHVINYLMGNLLWPTHRYIICLFDISNKSNMFKISCTQVLILIIMKLYISAIIPLTSQTCVFHI